MSEDWRTAPLPKADLALCAYADKLALKPREMREKDVAALREAGFDDRAIHDAAQVAAWFSYINRIADGLGVDLEPDMPARPGADGAIPDPSQTLKETGTMTIIWRCLKCNQHLPAGEPIPDACPNCRAPKTEFALVEED